MTLRRTVHTNIDRSRGRKSSAARRRLGGAGRVRRALPLELEDAVVVTRAEDGKIVLDQSGTPVASGAARGALWGGLIGILFLAPMLGAAMVLVTHDRSMARAALTQGLFPALAVVFLLIQL